LRALFCFDFAGEQNEKQLEKQTTIKSKSFLFAPSVSCVVITRAFCQTEARKGAGFSPKCANISWTEPGTQTKVFFNFGHAFTIFGS
jgi:hypothetical protein